jgi:hypothetical protein
MSRTLIAILAVALSGSSARADGTSASSPPSAPLCGVNSLYTALKAEGMQVNFADLLQPKYVSSQAGSTFPELRKAAIDHHVYAQLLEDLSTTDLANLKCPAILHVKPEFDSPEYNHFILCFPTSDGRLALYDPPDPLVRTSGEELAAVWDGTALAVSSRPIVMHRMWGHAVMRIVLVSIVGVGVLGCIKLLYPHMISSQWPGSAASGQITLVLLLSISIAATYHLVSPRGFLS